MTLILEIADSRWVRGDAVARKEFAATGGSIGRAADNDWVLADPHISSHHARVHFRDGRYWLEDVSTNGVYLDANGTRLGKGQMQLLESGMQIFLDQLKISVQVLQPAADRTVLGSASEFRSDPTLVVDHRDSEATLFFDHREAAVTALLASKSSQPINPNLTVPIPVDELSLPSKASDSLDFVRRGKAAPKPIAVRKNPAPDNAVKPPARGGAAAHEPVATRRPEPPKPEAAVKAVAPVAPGSKAIPGQDAALQAATRAGFDAALRYFNPVTLKTRLEQQGGGRSRGFLKQPNYWKLFNAHYRELHSRPDDFYREMVGAVAQPAPDQKTLPEATHFPGKPVRR